MAEIIVGTAGHIDHGKTALVRRLTGIDTDRLKEEKDRGISIDLGFAHRTLPSGRRVGIVDVPGHERFVKNMLAGATGVDLVLLVVAADEGVMPQTREHLAIVSLLGVDRGVVALTKSDLVDSDQLELARGEVREFLAGTPLRDAPIVPVSSVTGSGFPELLEALDRAAAECRAREATGPARLPVDRVFSLEGIGTVVTGTLWSGTIRPGDGLELLPAGRSVRVRQVEVHDQAVPEARAGQRTAVALHGVAREEAGRGDWLARPGSFRPSRTLDVKLRLLAGTERSLGSRTRLRVHLGASEILARAVLLDRERLEPGDEGWAQLRLESPAVAAARDRLVIRSYSPSVTVAGAVVVDPFPSKRTRLALGEAARLETLASGTPGERVAILAEAAGAEGVRLEDAAVRLGEATSELAAATAEARPRLVSLRDGRILAEGAWRDALDRIVSAVRRTAGQGQLRDGISKGELKSLLQREIPAAVFDEALETLASDGRLSPRGDRWAPPDAGPALTPEQVQWIDRLERKLSSQGFQVPNVSSLAPAVVPSAQLGAIVRYLTDSGRAVKVTSDLLYPKALWEDIEARVRDHLRRTPTLTMTTFKELLGVSRKYAVPILEHLDRTGLTRRQGDDRVAGPRSRA